MEVGGDLAGVEVQQIGTYGDCSLAVSRDGQLYGWGNSEYLQLASVTEATQVRRADVQLTECRAAPRTAEMFRNLYRTDHDGSVGFYFHLSVNCQKSSCSAHSESSTQRMMFKHYELES